MHIKICVFLLILWTTSLAWSESFIVDDGVADCPMGLMATHNTIQGAVDAAIAHADAASDIRICAGTYPENISMMNAPGKTLTLTGVGADPTTVVITGAGGGPGPIIDVNDMGMVDIAGLTVDGQSSMLPTTMFGAVRGIRYQGTDGSVRQVEVKNIGSADGRAQGLGINIQGTRVEAFDPNMPPTEKRVDLIENIIANVSRIGIIADGEGVYAHLEKNVITGSEMPLVFAFNGIQISRNAEGMALKNIINDALSPNPEAGGGAGVAIHCVNGVEVLSNTITNADLGVVVIDSQTNMVASNVVLSSTSGIDVQALGAFLGDPGCFTNPTIPPQSNEFSDNTILDALSTGFQLVSFDTNLGGPANNQFTSNIALGDFFSFFVSAGEQNTFTSNLALGNEAFPSMSDQTSGDGAVSNGGTSGKANAYEGNFCDSPTDDQLCTGFGGGAATTQQVQLRGDLGLSEPATSILPSLYLEP